MQSLGFTYDAVGNILSIDDAIDPARSQSFGYDVTDRLVSADGVYGTRGYGYDVLGNRLSRTVGTQPEDTYTYAPESNRLLAVTGPNAECFSYDAAGNTIAKARWGSPIATPTA